ncbi:phosphoglycerate dehydrogenase [Virgisporangium aliadipatigenens]|uniref:Phosphoglycerate dehydrogenase n=1 Tax=Virgisporangium aliadipatigenens TaxID=741659 RepID=A0A8J4DQ85_9ACTN|nr:2-hydroxyacid dehydrogenase [Virgisporangium aliadipatigenens]GIJ45686.1 phosphoglycerate dehydrogenase [Virgisporangium aliadipatigenens]
MKVWISHDEGRGQLGDVPDGVTVEIFPAVDGPMPSDPAGVEFWSPPFLSGPGAVELVARMPDLRVVQLMTAGVDAWYGKIPDRVTLCDGRGVHDSSTSEWAAAAILASVREFPSFARSQVERRWAYRRTGELSGRRVLIVGAGSIGTTLAARLAPFDVEITLVARRARDGVHAVEELPALLPNADIVVLLIPLTSQTRGLVDAAFLAGLPDGALVVNAARGPVLDTAALTAECASGRLHAALDVTDPEPLPAEHPLWSMPNVFITPHVGGSVPGALWRAYRLVGAQLRRFAAGEPLDNVVADGY